VSVAPQLSVEVTVKLTAFPQVPVDETTVMLPGQLITGAVVSTTETWNAQVEIFPETSVAVYVTVVTPTGKTVPGLKLLVIVKLQLSVAVGIVHEIAFEQFVVTISDGQLENTGATLSIIITLKLQVAELPLESVAVYITCVVPPGNVEPGA
jgi:hypothetical protein